jgi:hypothetical protein
LHTRAPAMQDFSKGGGRWRDQDEDYYHYLVL